MRDSSADSRVDEEVDSGRPPGIDASRPGLELPVRIGCRGTSDGVGARREAEPVAAVNVSLDPPDNVPTPGKEQGDVLRGLVAWQLERADGRDRAAAHLPRERAAPHGGLGTGDEDERDARQEDESTHRHTW